MAYTQYTYIYLKHPRCDHFSHKWLNIPLQVTKIITGRHWWTLQCEQIYDYPWISWYCRVHFSKITMHFFRWFIHNSSEPVCFARITFILFLCIYPIRDEKLSFNAYIYLCAACISIISVNWYTNITSSAKSLLSNFFFLINLFYISLSFINTLCRIKTHTFLLNIEKKHQFLISNTLTINRQ